MTAMCFSDNTRNKQIIKNIHVVEIFVYFFSYLHWRENFENKFFLDHIKEEIL